jgi:hypothetical protein
VLAAGKLLGKEKGVSKVIYARYYLNKVSPHGGCRYIIPPGLKKIS